MVQTNRIVANPYAGYTMVFTATAVETEGRWVEFEVTMEPGAVVPLHVHPEQTEQGTVLEGTLQVKADGRQTVLGPGERVVLPAGVQHALINAGPDRVRAVSRVTPALHFEELIRALVAAAVRRRQALPSVVDAAVILQKYPGEMYAGGIPLLLQRITLPLLAVAGRLMRRVPERENMP